MRKVIMRNHQQWFICTSNQLSIYKSDAHFTQNKLQGIQNNYNMEAKLIRCLLNNAIYIRKLVRICRNQVTVDKGHLNLLSLSIDFFSFNAQPLKELEINQSKFSPWQLPQLSSPLLVMTTLKKFLMSLSCVSSFPLPVQDTF